MTLQATNNFSFDTTYYSELLGQPANSNCPVENLYEAPLFVPGMEGQVCNIMGAIKAEKSTLHIWNNSLSQKDMLQHHMFATTEEKKMPWDNSKCRLFIWLLPHFSIDNASLVYNVHPKHF
jgi:hypothetical protein